MNEVVRNLVVGLVAFGLLSLSSRPALASAPKCFSQPNDEQGVTDTQAAAMKQCDCAGSATHFGYVTCVRQVAEMAVTAGTIRKACQKNVVRPMAESACGSKGKATCCETTPQGRTSCAVLNEAACRSRKGGIVAAPGSEPWCFLACGS